MSLETKNPINANVLFHKFNYPHFFVYAKV